MVSNYGFQFDLSNNSVFNDQIFCQDIAGMSKLMTDLYRNCLATNLGTQWPSSQTLCIMFIYTLVKKTVNYMYTETKYDIA